jgi:hypothetical protein
MVPSKLSPVCPISLRTKLVFVFLYSPRWRILNVPVLFQLFSRPDVNEEKHSAILSSRRNLQARNPLEAICYARSVGCYVIM